MANHVSAFDLIWVLPVFTVPIHFVLGAPFALRGLAWIWRAYDQINALAVHRGTVVDEAVKCLEAGKSVFICPEGDFQQDGKLGRLYLGFARRYRRTAVPIVPIAFVAPPESLREYPFPTYDDGRLYRCVVGLRGPFLINIGAPMLPAIPIEGTDKEIDECVAAQVKERIAELIDDIKRNKFPDQ